MLVACTVGMGQAGREGGANHPASAHRETNVPARSRHHVQDGDLACDVVLLHHGQEQGCRVGDAHPSHVLPGFLCMYGWKGGGSFLSDNAVALSSTTATTYLASPPGCFDSMPCPVMGRVCMG